MKWDSKNRMLQCSIKIWHYILVLNTEQGLTISDHGSQPLNCVDQDRQK